MMPFFFFLMTFSVWLIKWSEFFFFFHILHTWISDNNYVVREHFEGMLNFEWPNHRNHSHYKCENKSWYVITEAAALSVVLSKYTRGNKNGMFLLLDESKVVEWGLKFSHAQNLLGVAHQNCGTFQWFGLPHSALSALSDEPPKFWPTEPSNKRSLQADLSF